MHAACSRSPPLYVYLCAPVCAINVTYTPPFICVSFLGLSFSLNGIGDHLFWCYWRLFLSHSSRPAFFRGERSSDTRRNGSSFMTSRSLCCCLRALPAGASTKTTREVENEKRATFTRSPLALRGGIVLEIFCASVEKLDGEAENCF